MRALHTVALLLFLAACGDSARPDGGTDMAVDAGSDLGAPDAGPDATSDAGPTCAIDAAPEPTLPVPRRHTPEWAFEPWISKDISTTDDTRDFVTGFLDRQIPVGVVVLDSPWETNYHTFVPNPTRYHDFDTLVSDLHAQDIRIVLWMTAMENSTSYDLEPGGDVYTEAAPALAEGRACGFFVDDGHGYPWWKGTGAAVDFTNARARTWWHALQSPVIDQIDGWKLDFGEEYVTSDPVTTSAGAIPHQQYAESYYADFLAYGVMRRGDQFTTMVRPWDRSYGFSGHFFSRVQDAPIAWVGDNRRDWVGLEDALEEMFRSAQAGYVVLGSDVGGYLDRDDVMLTTTIPFDVVNFQRWVAVGAMSGFFELHGRANLAPWTVPDAAHVDETVDVYRRWATLHHAMVPFWYSLAEEAYAGGPVPIAPIGADVTAWAGDYRYVIGNAILVAPMLDGSNARDVVLPAGDRWYDWWAPTDAPHDGGTTVADYDVSTPGRIPMFVREGAMIPVRVDDDVNGLGDTWSAGLLTVAIWPSDVEAHFTLHEDGAATTWTFDAQRVGPVTQIIVPAYPTAVIVRVHATHAPLGVTSGAATLATATSIDMLPPGTDGWAYDAANAAIYIRVGATADTPLVITN